MITSSRASVSVPPRYPVKNGKNGKLHVLTLQDLEDDSLQFDLSAETLEELFKWYQAAWDITQRMISKEYNRQHEVSASCSVVTWVEAKGNRRHTVQPHLRGAGRVGLQQPGSDPLSVQSQIRQQVEVEKKEEVAMEMSDLVVYCQPRSKEKDRFGKDTQMLLGTNNVSTVLLSFNWDSDILWNAQIKD